MSVHVLFKLLNGLMNYKPHILSLFHNMFNKLNNTGAQMLDSIYHMTLSLIKITFLA